MSEIILARPAAENPPADSQRGKQAIKAFLVPIVIALAASGLVALCAHVTLPLPFTPVPLSLAPFAVLFLGLMLSPRMAFASLCLYLLEGAAGLPVFSPEGAPGILHLLGPTGGYLLSYPFAAALAGYLYRRGASSFSTRSSFPRGLVAAGAASMLILIAGAAWLKMLTHMDIRLVLAQAVVPFLPGDILKVCLAAAAARLAANLRQHRRPEDSL
jgi:biotin transport system substrate-specific component